MIKAVIFDFDGLILDTEIPIFRAWQEIFERHGCELTLDSWADYIGRSPETFDPCEKLEACLAHPVDRDKLHREQMEHEAKLIAAESVLPGVTETLGSAKRLGLKLGVASSSSRDWVIGHLARLGLAGFFDCIRCSDDVERTKPAADLYLAVLRALELQPEEAFALEDSPHGVSAAKAAGLFCVAVPNALTKSFSFDHADLVLSSLEEIPLEELLARIEGRSDHLSRALQEEETPTS
jgi:HAD superfamily hydrolase (TIGR01509 family)